MKETDMKKFILLVAMVLSSSAVAYTGPNLDTQQTEAEQFAYCAGIMIGNANIAEAFNQTEKANLFRKLGKDLAKRAVSLNPTDTLIKNAQDSIPLMRAAFQNDEDAQQTWVKDTNDCKILLKMTSF